MTVRKRILTKYHDVYRQIHMKLRAFDSRLLRSLTQDQRITTITFIYIHVMEKQRNQCLPLKRASCQFGRCQFTVNLNKI